MSPARERALVLAGGGAAGNAWELGVIAGLADAGVDVTRADLVVGTSAGATVAAQVTSGVPVATLYAAVIAEVPPPTSGPSAGPPPGRPAAAAAQSFLDWSNAVIRSADSPADMRRRLGAAALARDTADGAGTARWRRIVAARLPRSEWPEQPLVITAVDASTGEPVLFDRDSGVDLADAVAASTSSSVPYPIGGRRYLDGGYRRSENADLATGYAHIVVMVPFGGRSRMPKAWGMDLATQVGELRAAGSEVETVFPDAAAGDVFGANALDPATRIPAARAGHAQGGALATVLADAWGRPGG